MEEERKNPNQRIKYILLTMAFLCVILLIMNETGVFWNGNDRIFTGVRVAGVDLSNTERKEAALKLAAFEKRLKGQKFSIVCSTGEVKTTLQEMGVKIDIEKTIDKALSMGRRGSFWQKWHDRRKLSARGASILPIVNINEGKLKKIVDALAAELQVKAENASFDIKENGRVAVKKEKYGSQVDIKDTVKQIREMAASTNTRKVVLKFEDVKPEVMSEQLEKMEIAGLLSEFSTNFDQTATNRVYNINVAADALDDYLIKPGDTVSFNKIVGPRNAKRGYKRAPVIVNNEITDDFGGGVCQVSSTLYNAVLLANLEIVERTNHSLPVGYVPLGRDATVDFYSIDFKFRNNTGKYLLIKSKVQGSKLNFNLYGADSLKKDIQIETALQKVIEPKILYEDDQGLEVGKEIVKEEGKIGYQVRSFRVIKENGREVSREELPLSTYSPQNRVIAVGKKNVNILTPTHIN